MRNDSDPAAADAAVPALEGEPGIPSVTQPKTVSVSWKGILAVAMLVLSLVAVTAVSINRAFSSSRKDDEAQAKKAGERPAAAATEARKLDMTLPPAARASAPAPASAPTIPAIVPTADETLPDPIGVRRNPSSGAPGGQQRVLPEDAPVLLVSGRPSQTLAPQRAAVGIAPPAERSESGHTTDDPLEATQRNLEAYQRQLQGLLDTMTRTSTCCDHLALRRSPTMRTTESVVPPAGNGTVTLTGLVGKAV